MNRFLKFFLTMLLLCVLCPPAALCSDAPAGEPDRLAEDFVTAYLLVFAPGDAMYSQVGHACYRMRCPYYDLDYCFSYESEDVTQRVLRFLAGDLKMGMVALPTDTFLSSYITDNRPYIQYELRLPPEVETELWRVLDEKVAEGMNIPYDYVNNGCALATLRCLQSAVRAADSRLVFRADSAMGYLVDHTMREILHHSMPDTWSREFVHFTTGEQFGHVDRVGLPISEKLILPRDLAIALQHATVGDLPQTVISPDAVVAENHYQRSAFPPMAAALAVLAIALANIYFRNRYIDWLLLFVQSALGLLLIYLVFFSSLPATRWNILLIPFNPLPLICWRWRRYWAKPYLVLMALWVALMVFYPHMIVSWEHIILAIAIAVICFEQVVSSK